MIVLDKFVKWYAYVWIYHLVIELCIYLQNYLNYPVLQRFNVREEMASISALNACS